MLGGFMDLFSVILCVLAAGVIVKLWTDDYFAWRRGKPFERALPGATDAPVRLIVLSAAVSAGIVLVGALGDYAIGAVSFRSKVPAYYFFTLVSAAIIEELLFRGYCVIQSKGRRTFHVSVVFFSVVYAVLHGHILGHGKTGALQFVLAPGPMWWTFLALAQALLWYAVRFAPSNRNRSLLPSAAGHVAANVTVFLVYLAQGRVGF